MDFLKDFDISDSTIKFLNDNMAEEEILGAKGFYDYYSDNITFFENIGFSHQAIEDMLITDYAFFLRPYNDYEKFIADKGISNERFVKIVSENIEALYEV